MIISKVPVRIAFGGGGTDVEPYSTEKGGFVINSTISQYFRVKFNLNNLKKVRVFTDNQLIHKFEIPINLKLNRVGRDLIKGTIFLLAPVKGMDINLEGDPPEGAGLGASASLCCALIAGILKFHVKDMEKTKIAELAYEVEQKILKNEGGRQDQYAAVHGGINSLTFLGGKNVKVKNLKLTESFRNELDSNLILFYTGLKHVSGDLVKKQVDAYKEKQEESISYLDELKKIAYQIKDAIFEEDIEMIGKLMTKDLEVKQKFNPLLTTHHMKDLHRNIIKRGAFGGRVCGAGGGGSMLWALPNSKKKSIINYLRTQSGRIIDFRLVNEGLDIKEL